MTPPKWALESAKPIDAEFHEARKTGISGTDISAILGQNPWITPFDVWLSKTGQAPEIVETKAMRWGKRMEPFLIEDLADEQGLRVIRNNNTVFRSRSLEMMVGTPDAWVVDKPALGEAKTKTQPFGHGEWGAPGTDEVPDHYLLQCQWYAKMFQAEVVFLPVLIRLDDFRIYKIEAHPELQGQMYESAMKFWQDHVLSGAPPPIQHSETAERWLKTRFPRHNAPLLAAPERVSGIMAHLQQAEIMADESKTNLLDLQTAIKAEIGEAEGFQAEIGKVTWRACKDGTKTDWEAVVKDLKLTKKLGRLIKKHTSTKPGARRLLTQWKTK